VTGRVGGRKGEKERVREMNRLGVRGRVGRRKVKGREGHGKDMLRVRRTRKKLKRV
jgi:hypothetical protein